MNQNRILAFMIICFLLITYSWPYASNHQESELKITLEGSKLSVTYSGNDAIEGWGHLYGASDLMERDISLSVMGDENTLNQCTSHKEFYGLGDHLEYEISKSIFNTKIDYNQGFSMNSDVIISMVDIEDQIWASEAEQFLHGDNGKILILIGGEFSTGGLSSLDSIFKIDAIYEDDPPASNPAWNDIQYNIVNENNRVLAANKIIPGNDLSFGKFELFIVGGSMLVIAPCMADGKYTNDESGMASDIVKLISSGILQRYSTSNSFLDNSFRETYIFLKSFEYKHEVNLEDRGFENFRYIRVFMHNNDIVNPTMFLKEIVNPTFNGQDLDNLRSGFSETTLNKDGGVFEIEFSGLSEQLQTHIFLSSHHSSKNIVMHFPIVEIFCEGLGGGLDYQRSVKQNLENIGYNISVLDDEELLSLLSSGRNDFTLLLMGSILPDRIYSSESNLLRNWINSGGDLIWIGDKFLYWSYNMSNPNNFDLSSHLSARDQSQIDFFGRKIIPERFEWKEEVSEQTQFSQVFNLNFSYAPWGIGLEELVEMGGIALGKTGGDETTRSSVSLLQHGNGSIVHFGGCPTRWLHNSDLAGDINMVINSGVKGLLSGNSEVIEVPGTDLYVRYSYEIDLDNIDLNNQFSIMINGEISEF